MLELIIWTCPECGASNQDSPTVTAAPMCSECGEAFDWWQIEIDDLNLIRD